MSARPRVVVRIQGGLGNQLFQYAAGRTAAAAIGAEQLLAVYGRNVWPEGNPGLREVVRRPPTSAGPGERLRVPERGNRPQPRELAARVARVALAPILHVRTVRESDDPPTGPTDTHLYLDGYFQRRSWYGPSLDVVLDELVEAAPPTWTTTGIDAAIAFRRSDYVRLGWELPFAYYEAAIERLDLTAGDHVVLVGEERSFLDWVSALLATRGVSAGRARPIGGTAPLDDLWTLASARRLVMANSTFSWWAGSLGDRLHRDDHLVIQPHPWLPGSASDLQRPHWTTIDVHYPDRDRPPTL